MEKRPVASGLIAVSLLCGAWSNVIAACFCPRYSMDHEHALTHRSHMRVRKESSCNHEMSAVKMDDVRIDDVEMKALSLSERDWSSGVHAVFESSDERCTHCLMFSASTSTTATLVAVNSANRLLETDAPLVSSEIALTSSFSITIDPSEHGPPGNSIPRHILISVFRI